MTREEWAAIVERVNASWSHNQLTDETAVEWYDELERFDGASIWLAIRRCRREHHFRPSLAEVFDAIDADDQDERARRRTAVATVAAPLGRRKGSPMPPEFRRAMQVVAGRFQLASGRRDTPDDGLGQLDRETIAGMLADLADQHERRTAGSGQEHAEDAVRTCPECASSMVAGWVVTEEGIDGSAPTVLPCPRCREPRYQAVRAGLAHLEHDARGWPVGFDERRRRA